MKRIVWIALFFAVAGSSGANAQGNYPNKPIRWVIPYAPGGGTDVIARPIALKLGEALGVAIVYENRPGGGGLIAGETVARAAPDGYTLLVGSGNTHTFPTLLYDKVPYDPVKDYAPITNFVIAPNILVAHPSFPPKTPQELAAYGKAHPGKINWASSGNGAGGHLALVLFAREAGIKVLHVPFKGAGPAVTALLGGETDLLFANTGVFLGHIQSGKLRPLAVAAMKRLTLLPNVPTLNESGYPNFESSTYYGLLAPAGTPRAIIDRLHGELIKIIQSPESISRLASVGAFPVANTPEQFAEENRKDVAKWGKIIRENGIKAD
ncbi:MAG TPA: tripartite tricarboxylate transporter substrate binding protein [Burkholderiales bacterium]|nr:tripartite tricarboxylate transporter substrate binding protein [Burkholderiales bacterium]